MTLPTKTAVHEAGHVITGRELDIEIISADLRSAKSTREHRTTGGVTFDFKLMPGEEIADAIERKMTFAFGGMWAEEHILGIPVDSLEGIGMQKDDLHVIEEAAECGHKLSVSRLETSQRWAAARGRAKEITVRKRSDIIKVAKELDKHGYLSKEQINSALQKTSEE